MDYVSLCSIMLGKEPYFWGCLLETTFLCVHAESKEWELRTLLSDTVAVNGGGTMACWQS